MQGIQGGDGGVLSLPPNGENTHNSPVTDQGGRRRWRGNGDIHSVLSADTEVVGVTCIRMPIKGKQNRDTQRKLHVLVVEFKGGNYKGRTTTSYLGVIAVGCIYQRIGLLNTDRRQDAIRRRVCGPYKGVWR